MAIRHSSAIAMLLLATCTGLVAGEDYKAGDQVVVIADAKLKVPGNNEVDKVWPGLVLTVTSVNGQWLWVSNGKPGWLDKANVVPLDRRAIDRLTDMIKADPRNARLYNGRSLVWRELGELDIAMGDINEAIRLDPDAGYYGNRAVAWTEMGDYDKAIADFGESLRLDPKNALTYTNRGRVWNRNGDYDKAIADFNEAIRIDPRLVFAYAGRGHAWRGKGNHTKAIGDYNQAIQLDPRRASFYGGRAVSQLLMRNSETLDGFQKMIDLENGTGAYAQYGVIFGYLSARLLKDETRAKRFLSDSARDLGDKWPSPAVRFLRGEIGEEALLRLATDNDKQTEARCYVGLDYLAHGEQTKAVEQLNWVREHGPKSFWEYTIAVAELKRLGILTGSEEPTRRSRIRSLHTKYSNTTSSAGSVLSFSSGSSKQPKTQNE